MPPAKRVEVNVGDTTVSLSNLDKLMYPRAGFTKRDLIDYYVRRSCCRTCAPGR